MQRCPDGFDHGVSFLQHLIVPKPEDRETGLMQSLIANTISFAVLMLATVHLNNQPHFQAGKIEHKIQEWMLATEFETRDLPTTQALPQALFGISQMASQFALKRIIDDRTVCLALHPAIQFLLGYPIPSPALPLKGREKTSVFPWGEGSANAPEQHFQLPPRRQAPTPSDQSSGSPRSMRSSKARAPVWPSRAAARSHLALRRRLGLTPSPRQ